MSVQDPENYARYDYAWKTPGWSVQNPTVTYPLDGQVAPGLPLDVSLVRLYGSFLELESGRDLEGVLRLKVDRTLVHGPTGQQVLGSAMKPLRFGHEGFSLYLPATDDPQLTPAFNYIGRLTVRGVVQDFTFQLPAAVPEVNVTSLLTV